MKYAFSALLAAAALTAGATVALAQDAPAGGVTDVKEYGSFTVRCFPVKSLSPCDMYQERADKNSGQKILSMSIAYVPSQNTYGIQISVPLGVSLPKGLVIQTSAVTTPALPYHRCDRNGCYVEMRMEKDMIDKLAHSEADAKVKIVADSGKGFDLAISLNGFAAANDALMTLARAKATNAPPPNEAATAAAAGASPAAPAPAVNKKK